MCSTQVTARSIRVPLSVDNESTLIVEGITNADFITALGAVERYNDTHVELIVVTTTPGVCEKGGDCEVVAVAAV